MKNREKYKNELMDVIKTDGRICGFVMKHDVFRMFGKDEESFCEMSCATCSMGLQLWLDEEYEEPEVDWENVPVDTLVRVRDDESGKWTLRYFRSFGRTYSSYPPGYDYEVWSLGATSVTAEGDTERWKYCELVEEEDDGKYYDSDGRIIGEKCSKRKR